MRTTIAALALSLFALPLLVTSSNGADDALPIKPEVMSVTVQSDDGPVEITRTRNATQLIGGVLQPSVPVPGVTPIGEVEVLDALNDPAWLVIDMREVEWRLKSTIPGSIHIPYTEIASRMNELGCSRTGDSAWDCANARNIVAFCNGPACGQSPLAIKAMTRDGFPAEKIFYYRGGMQDWTVLGLTTVEGAF